jgi:DNA invertase Pin-like site-specific DNA recombinase
MKELDATSVSARSHPKVTTAHLQRQAIVYIRQSSMKQVEHNLESQRNQYRLADRAHELGWAKDRIQVIDSDLGLSGQGSEYRNGFNDLLAQVTLGHVGIILSYEVSRLARNNSDWYRLLDLAAVFGTLIADVDGVYEPRSYNDRLLLGLKGTMSEAELHVLRSRLEAGRLSKVRRGEMIQHVPTGFVRQRDGRVVKDPDVQIQTTIQLVLDKFAELGSCGKVMRYCRDHKLLLPRRQVAGIFAGELRWKPALVAAVLEIVKNPAYAGAFAYGRRQADASKRKPGHRASGLIRKPISEWVHIQQAVYPAYISWSQYLKNGERLAENGADYQMKTQRALSSPRFGSALLQGIAVCGVCGHHMHVVYKPAQRYACDALARHMGGKMCINVDGTAVDAVVAQAFFEAIQPAQLDVLDAVLKRQHQERHKLTQVWEQKRMRAKHEARLAERQYKAVDPDNRLVAASLESQWEQALKALRETEEAYERFLSETPLPELTPQMRATFSHIGQHLPDLWRSGQLTNAQKKELLRCLIDKVILDRVAAESIEVRIVWISGHYTVLHARSRRVFRTSDLSFFPQLVERVQQLCESGLNDQQMADQLTQEGFTASRSTGVPAKTVFDIRHAHGWPLLRNAKRASDRIDDRWTVRGLARHLAVSTNYVLKCIYDGTIPTEFVCRDAHADIYLIQDDPHAVEPISAKYAANGRHPRVRGQSHG